jgi:hypothetical protein
MGDCCCRIEKLQNGFEVEIRDPEIEKKNNARNEKSGYSPYKDPWVSYVFTDITAVLAFLKKSLPKASAGGGEFESSFDAAVAAPSDD